MRTEQEVMDLILDVAQSDERIRAVLLVGSRANPEVPKDIYQDYDITFFMEDITPYYNNPAWVEACFGKPLMMQKPETIIKPVSAIGTNLHLIKKAARQTGIVCLAKTKQHWILMRYWPQKASR